MEVERLPRGRHGLSREFVAQNQRERLLAALAECLEERGYDGTTVSMVGKRAGVSKSDFYKQFESKDACFLAAYDDAVERIRERARWPPASRMPRLGHAGCSRRSPRCSTSSPPSRRRRGWSWSRACAPGAASTTATRGPCRASSPTCATGAPAPAGGEPPPEATDEAVVGGIASLLARRVLAGETEQLPEFLPEIAEFALTPYLGAAEARRIISGR